MFKILQRLQNPKYSWFARGEAKVKYAIYSVMHELLQCQIAFPLFFNLLLVLEAGQFLWYAIHPDYDFLWTTTLSQYPRDAIKYFQFDALLREGDQNIYYAILYICFALQLFILACVIIVLIMLERAKKKSSSIVSITLKLLSFYAQLITTIGPIPLANVFVASVVCRDDDPLRGDTQCYTGMHLATTIVGVIGLVTLVVFSFLSQLLFIDMNPSSNIPFACPQSNLNMFKLLLKFGLAVYITLDIDLSHSQVFVGLYCLVFLFILILRYISQGYYNNSVTLCAVLLESLVFWGTVVSSIHAIIDDEEVDDTGLYYFLFASPFAMATYYRIFTLERWRLLKSNTRNFTRAIRFEKYVNLVIQLVDNIEEEESRIELEGLLRYHVKFCKAGEGLCPCHHMASEIAKEEDEEEEGKEKWFEFVKSILIQAMSSFPKNSRLHLQYAYFQQEKLHNRFKALFELVLTEETRPNIQEEFSIFRYSNIIEKEMVEDDLRNTDTRGIDVNQIVHFQEKLVLLQGEIGKAVNMQLDYWRELEQVNPNVHKLLSLGSRITVQGDVVKNSYTKICEINSNHIRMLKLYGNFLKDILHDKVEALRVLENAEYAERSASILDNDRTKYSENSKTCIISCSGNLHSMGKVLNANNESLDVLGYAHTDLIGQSVNVIMPNIIADIHDDLMMKYFETTQGRVMGRERIIFPMAKSGYILPCTLMIKVFPNLDEGLRVVGFLRKVDSRSGVEDDHHRAHYVLYEGEENNIYGVSQNCFESFGIPASLTTGDAREFTISSIFPDLLQQNEEELKSTTGVMCTIDTTSLEQTFLVGRQDSEEDIEDDETRQKRYRTSKVRAMLSEELFLLDKYKIKVLKFIEVSDQQTKVTKSDVVGPEQNQSKKRGNEAAGSQETDLDVSRSEGSSVSVSSAMGEDSRQLKDMKAKITEKNMPSSVSALQRFSIITILGLIIIAGVQYNERITMSDDLWTGLTGSRQAYLRSEVLPQINAYSRILNLMANGLPMAIPEADIKAELSAWVTDLDNLQFQVNQIVSYINETTSGRPRIQSQIRNMLLDGSITTSTKILNEALFEYIAAAQKVIKLPLTAFQAPLGPGSAEIPFYYIQRNGLNALRVGVEDRADGISDVYQDQTEYYSKFYLITMIVAIVFLFICQAMIIPRIFLVNRTNVMVLALFGYIDPEDIDDLAEKCENYMMTYLDELTAKREDSYYENEDEDLERSLQQPNHTNMAFKKRLSNSGLDSQDDSLQQNQSMQLKEFSYREEVPQWKAKNAVSQLMVADQESAVQITNKSYDDEKHLKSPINKKSEKDDQSKVETNNEPPKEGKGKDGKDKEKKEEEEEDEEHLEFLRERSKKLKNSKDNNKGLIIFQVMAAGLVIIGYFIGDFFNEEKFLSNYRQGLDHLQIISKRLPFLKYVLMFAMEELAEDDLSKVYPDIDTSIVANDNYRTQYASRVYQTQSSIKETLKMTFPGEFDDYLEKLLDYNNEDVCALYYANDAVGQATCQYAGLQQGLIQSEVTFVENIKSAMTQFYAIPNRNQQTRFNAITSQVMANSNAIMTSIIPVMNSLVDDFLSAFSNYFDTMFLIQRLKFFAILLCLIAGFLFIWLPYLGRLKRQIFRTKGLLNMIPMEMLKKNRILRETFTSNEIWRAVQ